MILELIQLASYPIMAFLAVIAIVLSVLFLKKIMDKEYEGEIKGVLVRVFSIVMVGGIFYATSVFVTSLSIIPGILPGLNAGINIFDLFWLSGAVLISIAFLYFSYYMYKSHNELKKGIITVTVSGVIIVFVVYYILYLFMADPPIAGGTIELVMVYMLPVVSAMLVVSTVSVYRFFRNFKEIGTPMLLLSIGFVFGLIGALFSSYVYIHGINDVVGAISSIMFVAGYSFATVAFYYFLKAGEIKPKKK